MSLIEMPRIRVAFFDMAATTVDDMVKKPGFEGKLPLVISAYGDASKKGGVELPFDELNACRGRDKIEVFREKVTKYRTDIPEEARMELAQQLHDQEFVPALLENVPYIKEMTGTTETFAYLKDHAIYVATGSGFPPEVTDAINQKLGWKEKGLVDFGTCGARAGGGRPKPHMINQVLVEAGMLPADTDLSKAVPEFDYAVLLKIGDTLEDIHEGQAVGATVIAVSSGTQSVDTLVKGNPKVVLPNVQAVPIYLQNHGYLP